MPEPEMPPSREWTRMALKSGAMFGVMMGVFATIQSRSIGNGVFTGVIAGACFGSLLTLSFRWLVNRQISKYRASPPDFGGETVLMEGPANHFRGVESVGGYLWVTEKRIHFASHRVNVQNHMWTLPLAEVSEVQASTTPGRMQNSLSITTRTGESHSFIVNNLTRWADLIRSRSGCA